MALHSLPKEYAEFVITMIYRRNYEIKGDVLAARIEALDDWEIS